MKQNITIILCFIFLFSCSSPKQDKELNKDYYDKCRELVLSENKIGQEYFFNVSGKTIDEISVVYLGEIRTKKGKIIRFLNSTNFTGAFEDARKATGSVFIYDDNGQRLGSYYVGGINSLPNKLDNGNLIFLYNNENCNQSTSINFVDSIPKQIFINCTSKGGDLYTFQAD